MKLRSLRLQNFRQHVATEILFEPGITGIIGPNGSGKTSILEAVAFALYAVGRTPRDQMISLHPVGRGVMRVTLEFDLGSHHYRVVRGRTTAELYLDGDPTPIANSSGGVTESLQRIMGMSKDEFFKTYFTSQKELAAMAAMPPADRGRFLSKVLGYEKLRTAQDLVSTRKNALAAEIMGLRRAMTDPIIIARAISDATDRVTNATGAQRSAEHRHTVVKSTLALLEPKWARVQKDREKAQALLADVTATEREATAVRHNLERVAAELATMAGSRAELTELQIAIEPLGELKDELQVLEELYREEGRRKTLVENEAVLREEIDKLNARLASMKNAPADEEAVTEQLEKKRSELEDVQGSLEAKRTAWVRDRQDAETKRNNLRQQWTDVRDQRDRVMSLGANAPCPTCSRALGDSLHTVVEHLEETLQTLEVDGQYYKSRFEQLSEMPAEIRVLDERSRTLASEAVILERKLAKVQRDVQDLTGVRRDIKAKLPRLEQMRRDIAILTKGFDAARFEFVRGEIARLTPLEQKAARLSALAERQPQLIEERTKYSENLDKLQSTLGTLNMRHKQRSAAAQDYDHLRAQYEKAANEARTADLDLHKASNDLDAANNALKTALAAGEESRRVQETVAQREGERRLHDELDRAFNEMRAQLNAELRPELSELATGFLRELMDSRTAELEIDEKYNVVILEDGVAKPVLSGGEEDIANLVLRLAVSQMIAERSGQAFSLLILDEIFGHLDESRRFNVLDLLRALGDRFEQVILITHIEAVRDGLDNVIAVRYDAAAAASVVESSAVTPESEELELIPAEVA
ncbi:MAG TPA: SMC family ATPase [Gemmatimonadaceae bacterium]|nr:SMC family ATPase [Gemmatimonadaceae bacterium]